MGYAPVVILLVAVTIVVALLLNYYGNRKTFPWYVQITAFLAWLFPFSIVFMLPLDLSSTLYRQCSTQVNSTIPICDEPVGHVEEEFYWGFWRTLYWTMFCLTWFIIPIMQSWLRSGEFNSRARFWDALKANLIYYGSLGILGAIFVIYLIASKKFEKPQDLLPLAMAAANAWGLLLCTLMLGYGLVSIPRRLWYAADVHHSLSKLEFEAPKYKESVVDAESEVYEVTKDISNSNKKVSVDSPLRPLMNRLLVKCPMATDQRGFDIDDETPDNIDKSYLISLHARVKRASKIYDRNQARYFFLLQKAWLYQDILENAKNTQEKIFKSSLVQVKEDKFKVMKLKYYWIYYIKLRPILFRVLSVLCGLASIVLIWSETVFNLDEPTLSVPSLILQSPDIGYVALEFVSMSFILYMCVCAYSTLFQVRYLDYKLVPQHFTDEGSTLFIGAYLCRLTFPLCYNFFKMVKDENNAVFIMFFGTSVNLAPLLGERYNDWLPVMVLVFSLIFFFRLHTRILSLLRIQRYFENQKAFSEEVYKEGQQLIQQARIMEERKLAKGEKSLLFCGSVSLSPLRSSAGPNALSSTGANGVAAGNASRLGTSSSYDTSKGTQDFLAQYKQQQQSQSPNTKKQQQEPLDRISMSSEFDESRPFVLSHQKQQDTSSSGTSKMFDFMKRSDNSRQASTTPNFTSSNDNNNHINNKPYGRLEDEEKRIGGNVTVNQDDNPLRNALFSKPTVGKSSRKPTSSYSNNTNTQSNNNGGKKAPPKFF